LGMTRAFTQDRPSVRFLLRFLILMNCTRRCGWRGNIAPSRQIV